MLPRVKELPDARREAGRDPSLHLQGENSHATLDLEFLASRTMRQVPV